MRARLYFALALATGCGRLDFERHAGGDEADASVDSAPADALGTCNSLAPFGTPRLISELSDPAALDGTLRLLPDELTGYMWSYTGRTDADLFYVTRPRLDAPFTMTRVTTASTTSQELDPSISSDGSMLVFRRSGPGDELYGAPVTSPGVLGTAVALASLNTGSVEAQGFLPIGRNELYFQSTRTMAGDIYMSTWSGGTTFSAPTVVPGLATASVEGDPAVTPDGLTIYFRSDVPAARAGFNIYVATRQTTATAFGAPTIVPNVNTDADDGPSWISPDGCRLYLSSDVAGTNDIYVATRGL
ncbi:MAG TPA: hypothetical protein VL326_08960 [Kofleriaceae bacterium]|jgi:Tol biopolymer transport system component|nr:hypothetical protein [Kofleriaceae bacterium]